jgi:DNA adenine methylase
MINKMTHYTCENCGKEFKQKSPYAKHLNRKRPCKSENKVNDVIQNVSEEKTTENKKESETICITEMDTEIITTTKLVKHVTLKLPCNTKPILKWVGGKTQILDRLILDFPIEINNYREIFLGGGSVLLALLSCVKYGIVKVYGNVYAYDINEPLIYIYKNIQNNHDMLFEEVQKLIISFNNCNGTEINRSPKTIEEANTSKESYYYWIRNEYNKLSIDDKKNILGSAMFIFLNKTCFRGVFRVGPRGFNVPYGHYTKPEVINKDHLDEIHELIQNVIFECSDFNTSLNNVQPNDYVYLDPPYAPETTTSFVGYTENGFNIENHNNLFGRIHQLTETNTKMMLSNADVSLVRENFTNEKYNITSILCKRAINSKNPDAKAKEVIIKNY